ncbi:MAG: hypothetical protein ACHQ0Y_04900 [Thermodesulfovibrionales bacterium]
MKVIDVAALKEGTIYVVRHRNNDKSHSRATRRVFKGMEKRLRTIPCCVFSSRIPLKGRVEVDGDKILYTNCAPASELSIPVYDLVEIRDVQA